jgi:hypothetical protein
MLAASYLVRSFQTQIDASPPIIKLLHDEDEKAQSDRFLIHRDQFLRPMHTILWLLTALFMPTTWSLAYIMDDTNQTIQYSPPDRWETVSCDECYSGTEYGLVLYPWTCKCAHPWTI